MVSLNYMMIACLKISLPYECDEIIPIISNSVFRLYRSGECPQYLHFKYRKGNKWGSVYLHPYTKKCLETVPCLYDDVILNVVGNRYIVKRENKFGIYKTNPVGVRTIQCDGHEIYSCIYDNITYDYSDMTFVLLKGGDEQKMNIKDI